MRVRKCKKLFLIVFLSLSCLNLVTYIIKTYDNKIHLNQKEPSVLNYRSKTILQTDYCNKLGRNVTKSLAIPPHYPLNGTSVFVTKPAGLDFTKVNKLCHTNSSLDAILPVYSAIDNHARRLAIRNTIGESCEQYKCKIVFIIGFPKDGSLSPELEVEYDNYGDILFINRVDSYRDLNDKAVAMLDWLVEVCSKPKYVIHFVDDTYVNVKLFLEDLQPISNGIYGCIGESYPPIRDSHSQYYVNKTEYPYAIYPDFVVGAVYAFPNYISKSLRCAVHDAIYVWLEDVWLTGHVRELAGIEAVQTRRREQWMPPVNVRRIDNTYILVHPIKADDFYTLHHIFTSKSFDYFLYYIYESLFVANILLFFIYVLYGCIYYLSFELMILKQSFRTIE